MRDAHRWWSWASKEGCDGLKHEAYSVAEGMCSRRGVLENSCVDVVTSDSEERVAPQVVFGRLQKGDGSLSKAMG